ncbi:MAG: hypothetical protein AB1651_14370 [Pseudomonadota bacterium]
MNTFRSLSLAVAAAALAACASSPQQENDPAFGSSVRNMISAQVHNPAAVSRPGDSAPDGIDGERAASVLKTYRSDVDKPARAQEGVTVRVND